MILLDTHAWLWWAAGGEKLSPRAREAISTASSIGVSPLSCFEIATGVRKGRIGLDRPVTRWLRDALGAEGIAVVDLHPQAAAFAGRLGPAFTGDPIDRLLYGTARHLDVPLVTGDRRLREADPHRTLW